MTSLILLSGDTEAALASRHEQAFAIATDRLSANGSEVLGGGGKRFRRIAPARGFVGMHAKAYRLARRRASMLPAAQVAAAATPAGHFVSGEDDLVLGRSFVGRMARRAKNVTKKATHGALQTARAAKQISQGDIAGALSRAGSTISNVTGSGAGSSLEAAAANMQGKPTGLFSSWKGYALTGGGLVSVLLVVALILKRRK